jgi:hypothetical protein
MLTPSTRKPISFGSSVLKETASSTIDTINTMQKHVPPTATCHTSGTVAATRERERERERGFDSMDVL